MFFFLAGDVCARVCVKHVPGTYIVPTLGPRRRRGDFTVRHHSTDCRKTTARALRLAGVSEYYSFTSHECHDSTDDPDTVGDDKRIQIFDSSPTRVVYYRRRVIIRSRSL